MFLDYLHLQHLLHINDIGSGNHDYDHNSASDLMTICKGTMILPLQKIRKRIKY